jgi:hypothetical protein
MESDHEAQTQQDPSLLASQTVDQVQVHAGYCAVLLQGLQTMCLLAAAAEVVVLYRTQGG